MQGPGCRPAGRGSGGSPAGGGLRYRGHPDVPARVGLGYFRSWTRLSRQGSARGYRARGRAQGWEGPGCAPVAGTELSHAQVPGFPLSSAWREEVGRDGGWAGPGCRPPAKVPDGRRSAGSSLPAPFPRARASAPVQWKRRLRVTWPEAGGRGRYIRLGRATPRPPSQQLQPGTGLFGEWGQAACRSGGLSPLGAGNDGGLLPACRGVVEVAVATIKCACGARVKRWWPGGSLRFLWGAKGLSCAHARGKSQPAWGVPWGGWDTAGAHARGGPCVVVFSGAVPAPGVGGRSGGVSERWSGRRAVWRWPRACGHVTAAAISSARGTRWRPVGGGARLPPWGKGKLGPCGLHRGVGPLWDGGGVPEDTPLGWAGGLFHGGWVPGVTWMRAGSGGEGLRTTLVED